MIAHILIGFEVFESGLESLLNNDSKKSLIRKLFESYPTDISVIESKLDYYDCDEGKFVIYTCIVSYDPDVLSTKSVNSKMSEFESKIKSIISEYFDSVNIIYKV